MARKKTNAKTKIINLLDRRKCSKKENFRLAIIGLTVIFILGLFLPFIDSKAKLSIVDNDDPNIETVIFQPQSSLFSFSMGDFITHKPLKDFSIFGSQIGEIEFLGINLYNFLTTPFPNFDGIRNLDSFLSSGILNFLISPEFIDFCNEHLGEIGTNIIALGQAINDIANQAESVTNSLVATLNNLNNSSENIRNLISQIESSLNVIDNIIILFFLLIIAVIVLLIFEKGPKKLPIVFLTICSSIFILVGIGVVVADILIANIIASSLQDISMSIQTFFNEAMPGVANLITNLKQNHFSIDINIFCGPGWWISTIALTSITILAYIKPKIVSPKK